MNEYSNKTKLGINTKTNSQNAVNNTMSHVREEPYLRMSSDIMGGSHQLRVLAAANSTP